MNKTNGVVGGRGGQRPQKEQAHKKDSDKRPSEQEPEG